LTLGQEWSAYVGMLSDDLEQIEHLQGVYRLALEGTAVGTESTRHRACRGGSRWHRQAYRLPFVTAPNKFTVQEPTMRLSSCRDAAHAGCFSHKIANDLR
jgi:fumarate hydratase class II